MTTALPPDSPESVSASQKTGISVAEIPREQRVAALLLSRYNLRYLVRLYAAFEGDLLLPIVLGEVALYNVSGLLPDDPAPRPHGHRVDLAALRAEGSGQRRDVKAGLAA